VQKDKEFFLLAIPKGEIAKLQVSTETTESSLGWSVCYVHAPNLLR
jgi:hypothetical protein